MTSSTPSYIPKEPWKLGWDDYAALPGDGKRYEIMDGELHMTPAPGPRHQYISHRLVFGLTVALEEAGRGLVLSAPIDVVTGKHDIFQPDIVFIATERLGIITDRRIEGAPDLVMEVLSPSTRRIDILQKSRHYARSGIENYWIAGTVTGDGLGRRHGHGWTGVGRRVTNRATATLHWRTRSAMETVDGNDTSRCTWSSVPPTTTS